MIFKLSSNKLSILSNNQLEQINACKVLKNFYHFSFPFTCILTHVCLCPYADFKDAQRQLKSYTHTHTHTHIGTQQFLPFFPGRRQAKST